MLLPKIRCAALSALPVAERWCGVIPADVSKWNQYISDGFAALPTRRCARASVQVSLLVLVEVRL
jgi:hypothetical protein